VEESGTQRRAGARESAKRSGAFDLHYDAFHYDALNRFRSVASIRLCSENCAVCDGPPPRCRELQSRSEGELADAISRLDDVQVTSDTSSCCCPSSAIPPGLAAASSKDFQSGSDSRPTGETGSAFGLARGADHSTRPPRLAARGTDLRVPRPPASCDPALARQDPSSQVSRAHARPLFIRISGPREEEHRH